MAPLQKINIANCRLSSLPEFGILPELVQLNISFNAFDQITPQQFSPFCALKYLAIENSTELSPCMCKSLQSYYDRRHITLKDTFDCPTIHESKQFRQNGFFEQLHFSIDLGRKKLFILSLKEDKNKQLILIFDCYVFFFLQLQNSQLQKSTAQNQAMQRMIHQNLINAWLNCKRSNKMKNLKKHGCIL